ncbi:MAG: holin family protein [Sporolactobacillus sp.]|jgi:toxin secretion/phage lysis holin|nr:holin family protein [Sporolactobacillus sp.]MCI1881653.1 holin family protein [Sporolactobacillus sp.]
MHKAETISKSMAAIFGASAGYLFGGWSPLLDILIAFMAIDYISGLLSAAYLGQLSSKVGFRGIARKVMILFIVAVAHLSDRILMLDHIVMNAAIYFYLANELISIIENAGQIGLPVPKQLKRMIQIFRDDEKRQKGPKNR